MAARCGMDDVRGDLLTELTTGFEALLDKVDALAARNAEMEKQLRSFQEGGRAQFTPEYTKGSSTGSDDEEEDMDNLPEGDPRIVKGMQAYELLKLSMTGTVPLRKPRWRKLSPNRTLRPKSELERDFTTQGVQGDLRCPFSKTMAEIEDHPAKNATIPIHLEPADRSQSAMTPELAHSASRSGCAPSKSMSKSNTTSLQQCPIRFLDQMTPEEVAKYFEEHKHEIPRSHEVCVKRYQTNEQSVRSLDAKYGSLVNMIKGLGEKHQPMLPSNNGSPEDEEEEEELLDVDKKSLEKVEKWAEGCVDGPAPDGVEEEDEEDDDDDRTGHFERPLKEVRLGESPSRPWGIQVPLAEADVAGSDADEKESVAAPVLPETQKDSKPPQRPAGKCPFGHGAAAGSGPKTPAPKLAQDPSPAKPEPDPQKKPTPMDSSKMPNNIPANFLGGNDSQRPIVFTGPVFFGYSAEEAAKLMRSMGQ